VNTLIEMLQWWSSGMERPLTQPLKDAMHNTCVVTCMDFRTGELFSGAYRVQNAGPRWQDAERSVKAFLQLKKGHNVYLAWLSHSGGCGASKLESGASDPKVIEEYTSRARQKEVEKMLRDKVIAHAVRDGVIKIVVGEVEMDSHGWIGVKPLVEETQQLLRSANLPPLD
jgi:hypothetical protein